MDAAAFPLMLGFSHLPVSPPPDHSILFNKQHPTNQVPAVTITNPLLFKSFAREMEAPVVKKAPTLLEMHFQQQQLLREKAEKARQAPAPAHVQAQAEAQAQAQAQTPKQSLPTPPLQACCDSSSSIKTTTTNTTSSSATKVESHQANPQLQQRQQSPSQSKQQRQPQVPVSSQPENPFLNHTGLLDSSMSSDPKYIQMVSRMAAYYQQRCQAILNYQQQRCQTWATSHRQKCQDMMQAAMLVVAWYIRDRIGRRRRRNKRSFHRALREKNSAAVRRRTTPTKGETVRKWVMDIPEAALSPNNGRRDDTLMDKEECDFDIEKEVGPDKDSQLFLVADQMIKSQLAKIDVPLLGALNLDDSDSESESDDEKRYYYEPEDYGMDDEEEDADDYDEDDNEDDEDEDYEEEDASCAGLGHEADSGKFNGDFASKEALNGTAKGSLKRKRSESTSGIEYRG